MKKGQKRPRKWGCSQAKYASRTLAKHKWKKGLKPGWTDGLRDDGSEYTREEVEFIMAMDRHMTKTGSRFPDYRAVLAVAHSLGYYLPAKGK